MRLFRVSKKKTLRRTSLSLFPPEKSALLPLLEKGKPSPHRKMIKLLTLDNLVPPLRHSHQKAE